MKKLAALSLISLIMIFASCKKEDKKITEPQNPPSYEERLEGEWELVYVKYSTEIPDLISGGSPIPINGDGENVSGTFILKRNPHRVDYNFKFSATVDFGAGPITIPVELAGSGDWTTTSDNSKLIITADTGEEIIFDVKLNSADQQVFTSTFNQNVNGIFNVEVDLEMGFGRM